VSQKNTTFFLGITWQILTDFQNSFNADSSRNLQQDHCYISDRILNMFLHYLVKYKRSKIAKNLTYLTH